MVPVMLPVSHEVRTGTEYASCLLLPQGSLATGTFASLDSLVLTLTSASPSVSAVLGNSGHPELSAFVDSLSSGSASLDVTFTPGFYTDGSNALTFSGTCASVCPDAACRMGLSSVAESLGAMASVAPLVSHMSLPLLLGNTLAARNVVADAD